VTLTANSTPSPALHCGAYRPSRVFYINICNSGVWKTNDDPQLALDPRKVCRLPMWRAAFVRLERIGLHPAPNATGIHLNTTLGHQFADVLVGERIPSKGDFFVRGIARQSSVSIL
jgi:hypothetical protein